MSWTTETLVDGWNTVLYSQVAGSISAPTASDEVPYGTEFDWSASRTIVTRLSYLNKQDPTSSVGGIDYNGSFSINLHAASSTVRNIILDAVHNGTRLKLILRLGGTGANSEVYVWDNVIVSIDGTVDPSDVPTYTFNWEADSFSFANWPLPTIIILVDDTPDQLIDSNGLLLIED